MPLEDLLAMYGYDSAMPSTTATSTTQESHSQSSTSEEDILNNQDLTLDKEEVTHQ